MYNTIFPNKDVNNQKHENNPKISLFWIILSSFKIKIKIVLNIVFFFLDSSHRDGLIIIHEKIEAKLINTKNLSKDKKKNYKNPNGLLLVFSWI